MLIAISRRVGPLHSLSDTLDGATRQAVSRRSILPQNIDRRRLSIFCDIIRCVSKGHRRKLCHKSWGSWRAL